MEDNALDRNRVRPHDRRSSKDVQKNESKRYTDVT